MDDMTPSGDVTGRRMVEGVARVVATDGGRAWLEADTGACGGCAMKTRCGGKVGLSVPKRFSMPNDFGGRVGERIVVGIPEGALLRASATAYLLPLAGMLVAAVGAEMLGGGDAAAALSAGGGLIVGLLVARLRAARLTAGGRLTPVTLRRAADAASSCEVS